VAVDQAVTLGTATLQGVFEDDSPEWHAQRANVIGGSEIASIVQAPGAFTSRYVLWYKKAGFIDEAFDEESLERFEWGHRNEPTIRDKFRDKHPEFAVNGKAGSWVHKDRPWHGANPDGLLSPIEFEVDDEGNVVGEVEGPPEAILEIKCSGSGYGWEHDTCPIKYVAQIRWYMECFGFEYGYLVVLIGGWQYREFLVPRDPMEPVICLKTGEQQWYSVGGQEMIDAGEAFYQSLPGKATAEGTPPPADGGEDTWALIKEQNPELLDEKVDLDPVDVYRANAAVAAKKAAEEEERRAKGVIVQCMGKAKSGMVNGKKVARRQATKSGTTLYLL
jgi:putative phage-type endonuclease